MNVVIMLLETNCLSLSLAQNRSAPSLRYRRAVVASPGAGQGLAGRRGLCVSSWVWYLPHQSLGWRPPCPVPRSLGLHRRGASLYAVYPSLCRALPSRQGAGWEDCGFHPSNLGSPQLCSRQGGGSRPNSRVPGQGCRTFAAPPPSHAHPRAPAVEL